MLAARDAEASGEGGRAALDAFYRTLMNGTLLLPVPPEHGDEAKSALEAAVNDDEEVEVSVLLAADADGQPTSVCFASRGGPLRLVAARDGQSCRCPRGSRSATWPPPGVPAIMDPAGPIPYRFEPEELTALAAGRPSRHRGAALPHRARALDPPAPAGAAADRAGAVAARCPAPGPMSTPPGWSTRRATGQRG